MVSIFISLILMIFYFASDNGMDHPEIIIAAAVIYLAGSISGRSKTEVHVLNTKDIKADEDK